jgi:putative ABC transport system permease protein
MKLYRNIKLSIKALLLNRSRTVFSVLGMAVGIAAVIVTVAIGDGARQKALEPIKAMGTNVMIVNSGKLKEVFGRKKQVSNVTTLKLEDAEILSEIEGIEQISPFQQQSLNVKYQDNTISSLIQGVSKEFPELRDYNFRSGRVFTEREALKAEKVAIIGADAVNTLFPNEDPLNKTIFINKNPFRVIGVLQPKGLDSELGNIDNVVMVPIKTALRRLFNLDYLFQIHISVDELENLSKIENEVVSMLRENHRLNKYNKEDDFTIVNQLNAIKASEETSKGFNTLTIGVASISLIIGGIGILAVMILSVRERINEIGLRKSVGAKNFNIIIQFLSEALLLGITGGLLGALLGIIVALLLNSLSDWNTFISWQAIMVSFGFSILTALIFGVFPARQAARLDPIEALRTE